MVMYGGNGCGWVIAIMKVLTSGVCGRLGLFILIRVVIIGLFIRLSYGVRNVCHGKVYIVQVIIKGCFSIDVL